MRGILIQGSINQPPAMRQVKPLHPLVLPYDNPWWREDLNTPKKNIASGEDVLLAECV